MSTKQVLFRLDDNTLTSFDSKLSEKGISKQFFFSKCVEMFVDGSFSLDSNEIPNDSKVQEIKKQLADILTRLDRLEHDNNEIANDKVITQSDVEDNDSNMIANNIKEDSNNDDGIKVDKSNDEHKNNYLLRKDDTNPDVKSLGKAIDIPAVAVAVEPEKENKDDEPITPKKQNEAIKSDRQRAKFITLAKKHNLHNCSDTELKSNLISFLSKFMNRSISHNNISKIASKHKSYLVDEIFWEYFRSEKVSGKWQWSRIKPIN